MRSSAQNSAFTVQSAAPGAKTRGGVLLDVLGGLGLLALSLLVLEQWLPLPSGSFSRGFDAEASYIVPNPEVPGGWRTQINRTKFREIEVPAADHRPRLVLFGGSNTAGFPEGELRAALRDLYAPAGFSTSNLGIQGYGSGRVRTLVEQTIELVRPEIVVVYSGHNEFVERSFEMDVEVVQEHGALEEVAKGSRLYSYFVGRERAKQLTRESEQRKATNQKPKEWAWEYGKFKKIHYGETLQQLEVYRENLRAMCLAARRSGTKIILCTTIYNRMTPPFSATFPPEMPRELRKEAGLTRARGYVEIPEVLHPVHPVREMDRVHAFDWGVGEYADRIAPANLEGRRLGTGALEGFDPQLQEEARWKPKVRWHDRALAALWRGEFSAAEFEGLRKAEELYLEALAFCPDNPRVLFELGIIDLALGRDPAVALAKFDDAARYDRAPRKSSPVTNEIVREVAREFEDVCFLFDADEYFISIAPDGIVGWELMIDHCHLSRGARVLLLKELARRIREKWKPAEVWREGGAPWDRKPEGGGG